MAFNKKDYDTARETLKGKRFLVVDDEIVNINFFLNFFEDLELNLDVAYNGEEAVDRVFSTPPGYFCAILMDIRMPKLDGVAATQQIKARPEWSNQPIIAMSGNSQPQDLQFYLNSGMVDLLSKPADLTSIIAMLIKWSGVSDKGAAEDEDLTRGKLQQPGKAHLEGLLSGVDIARRLNETGISFTGYKRLLQAFLISQQGAMDDLHRGLNDHSLDVVGGAAHKLAGACGNIGAGQVSMLAKQLENQCKPPEAGIDIQAITDKIDGCLSVLCLEIARLCDDKAQ